MRRNKKTVKNNEYYRKKASTLAKKIVRTKHNFTCEYCGKKEPQVKTHGSHIYSEGTYRGMSCDFDNILCLCYTHHLGGYMQTKEPSWHKNPMEMVEWFRKKYPKRADKLRIKAQHPIKKDFKVRLEELKKQINNF